MGFKNTVREEVNTTFASVLADGKIHVAVPEGTEGSVVREYETSDGKNGSKTELVYTELTGKIESVQFQEGQYGTNILVIFEAEEEDGKTITLALNTESNFAEDVMKKLPNLDLKKEVTFAPYSFDDERGKKKRGVSITQKNKKGESIKLVSFYHDAEKKAVTNGYPKPPTGKTIKKSAWRDYFRDAREFLMEDLKKRAIATELAADGESEEDHKSRKKSLKDF